MNISLLNHQLIHKRQSDEPEDIANIVSQQLANLEKNVDAPSEFALNNVARSENEESVVVIDASLHMRDDYARRNRANHKTQHDIQQVQRKLKQATYKKTIAELHDHTNALQKTLKLLFHNPVISLILEGLHATILRPLPFLAGSLLSLLGGVVLLIATYTTGVQLNAFVVIAFFMVGYCIGVAIDFAQVKRELLKN